MTKRRLLKGLGGLTVAPLFASRAEAHEHPYGPRDTDLGTDASVAELVDAMTLEEKVERLHPHLGPLPDFSTGYMAPLDRLDVPGLTMADGPVGVRHPILLTAPELRDLSSTTDDPFAFFVNVISGGPSTAFPSPISLAAGWDTDRMHEFGTALASEARAKDQDVVLAPGINIARVPELGRNFEYFGEDPYLTSRSGVAVIEGIQSMGVVANAKHFAANNQEEDRMSVSASVDERPLREIYLPAFRAAVQEAEVGSVMAAYNRVNGTYSTEHERLLTDVLRDEWGFEGFVVSDWGAINDPVAAANAGTDWDGNMRPFQEKSFDDDLLQAVEDGDVPESRVDEMVTRMLRQSDRFGVLDGEERPEGEANTSAHQALARELAVEGGVLLRNADATLPLDVDDLEKIAMVGPEVREAKTGGGGSSNITTPPGSEVSPVEGVQRRVGDDAVVTHTTGEFVPGAKVLASAADVSVVVATGNSKEQVDRDGIELPYDQNELVAEVAAVSERTVVVLRTAGPVTMPWLDDVDAVLQMWFPGMKDGLATADLLFGDANPSGKLPMTFGESRSDYPATDEADYPGVDRGDGYPVVEYSEGLYVGYRWFDEHDIEPLFPFGYGQSYTEFAYDSVQTTEPVVTPSGRSASVEATVTNTGDREGAEVVQAYVAAQDPVLDRPPKSLQGFEKVRLDPGESVTVTFEFVADDLSVYDPDEGEWVLSPGRFDVLVGSSSRDLPLRTTIRAANG